MRWKALFFRTTDADTDDSQDSMDKPPHTYGLKSKRNPPKVDETKAFENDLFNIVENIQFRKVADPFQDKLSSDTKSITSSNQLFVPAEKTKNYYKLGSEQYNKLLTEIVTSKYKPTEHYT